MQLLGKLLFTNIVSDTMRHMKTLLCFCQILGSQTGVLGNPELKRLLLDGTHRDSPVGHRYCPSSPQRLVPLGPSLLRLIACRCSHLVNFAEHHQSEKMPPNPRNPGGSEMEARLFAFQIYSVYTLFCFVSLQRGAQLL